MSSLCCIYISHRSHHPISTHIKHFINYNDVYNWPCYTWIANVIGPRLMCSRFVVKTPTLKEATMARSTIWDTSQGPLNRKGPFYSYTETQHNHSHDVGNYGHCQKPSMSKKTKNKQNMELQDYHPTAVLSN